VAPISRAVSLGLIPDALNCKYTENITRAEFCTVLAQLLLRKDYASYSEFKAPTSPTFTDTTDPDITWLNALGVVNGVGNGKFNPYGNITRQEAAVMLKRAAVAFGADASGTSTTFADQSQVADWAKDALGFVVEKGIMNGTGNNTFTPLGMYTREQAYTTLVRSYDVIPLKSPMDDSQVSQPGASGQNNSQPMKTPFVVNGVTMTITGTEVRDRVNDSAPVPGKIVFVVLFTHETASSDKVIEDLYNYALLVAKNGTSYGVWGSSLSSSGTYELSFPIPDTIDRSGITFSWNDKYWSLS